MTQEEKARAYDEALKKAKQFHDKDLFAECNGNLVEYIFPELAESEDEKVRKALIRFHKSTIDIDGIKGDDILAWLEKQGEQKVTNKVESRFKVGDWIVQENIGVYKIIEICESWYEVIDVEDNHYSIAFDKEYMCHLWSIKDAKDGDVLVASDGSIFLFAGVVDLGCQYYIALELEDETIQVNDNFEHCWESVNGVTPATKEQRNLLFQKMKQAGYMWDDEKKELRKIERKSTWSAEDERNLEGIIDEIEANKNDTPDYDLATYDRFLSWLKSIKKRIGE